MFVTKIAAGNSHVLALDAHVIIYHKSIIKREMFIHEEETKKDNWD